MNDKEPKCVLIIGSCGEGMAEKALKLSAESGGMAHIHLGPDTLPDSPAPAEFRLIPKDLYTLDPREMPGSPKEKPVQSKRNNLLHGYRFQKRTHYKDKLKGR